MRAFTLIPLFLCLIACNSQNDSITTNKAVEKNETIEITNNPLRMAVIEKLRPFSDEHVYDCINEFDYYKEAHFELNGAGGTRVEGLFYINLNGTFSAELNYFTSGGCSEGDGYSICKQYFFDRRNLNGKWTTTDGETVIFEDFGVASFRNRTTIDFDVTEDRMVGFTIKHRATIQVKNEYQKLSYYPLKEHCKK